jgi:acetoin utilization protein AcuC
VFSPELESLRCPEEYPSKPIRAVRAREIAHAMGFLAPGHVTEVPHGPADTAALSGFHAPDYLDALRQAAAGHRARQHVDMGLGTPDCPVFPEMYAFATLACGAALRGADAIVAGDAQVAFSPFGGYHHAGPARAAGFCYLNDVVLACQRLTQAGLRVFALDVDAHHGDGVQDAFYDRREVLYMSLHESGESLFPGTGSEREIGRGKGRGYTVNVPFPPDTYDEVYLDAFTQVAVPLLEAYAPDAVVLELGMDALAGDPLAHMALTNNALATVVRRIVDTGTPVLATGGGGYHIANTARGWALLWGVMSGAVTMDHAPLGLGGVFLESTEWQGGLQDRARAPSAAQRQRIEPEVNRIVAALTRTVFPCHGL